MVRMRKVFVYVLINEEAILAKLKWASRPDHFRRRRGIHDLALNLKDIENPHDRVGGGKRKGRMLTV
jgi:hypothetical protein